MNKQVVICRNKKDTEDFAGGFAKGLKAGDIVELLGDLGSGKTFFVKALCRALSCMHPATSPSFVLKNEYKCKFRVLHFDFYRVHDKELIAEELKEDLDKMNGVILVEWAEPVRNVLPKNRYMIKFDIIGENSRRLTVEKNDNTKH